MVTEGTRFSGTTDYLPKRIPENIFLYVVIMCKFGKLCFLHTFPANMLKNCGLANINALFGQKGKNVTGKWDRTFFKLQITSGLFLEKYIYIFTIFSLYVLFSIIGVFLFSLYEEYWAHNFRLMSRTQFAHEIVYWPINYWRHVFIKASLFCEHLCHFDFWHIDLASN